LASAGGRLNALMRFPPSLRTAARMALGVVEPGEEGSPAEKGCGGVADVPRSLLKNGVEGSEPGKGEATGSVGLHAVNRVGLDPAFDPVSKKLELEAKRREFSLKAEEGMLACRTDFQLWQAMEKDVFSMIKRLGVAEGLEVKQNKSGRRTKGKAASLTEPEPELDMGIYGPCYPSLLLFGTRLLDARFSISSSLALSVLPRIKDLGLASYVLGVGTPFYNTLMSIYWYRYGHVDRVLGLLEEMRHTGLYFDGETIAIVDSMRRHLDLFAQGAAGSFLKEVMAFDSARSTRLQYWARTIPRNRWEDMKESR